VGVYAPVEGKEQETEEFYRELQQSMDKIPKKENIILSGDLIMIMSQLIINTYVSLIDIFVNCNWVNTRWQWYSTHNKYIGQHK